MTAVTDDMVEAFRAAWLEADRQGQAGSRVRAGLEAALTAAELTGEQWRAVWRPQWVDRLGYGEPHTRPLASEAEAREEAYREFQGPPPRLRIERRTYTPAAYGEWVPA